VEANHAVLAIILGGLFAPAQAQEASRELVGFDVSAAIDARWEENAGLQPKSEEQVDEIQTISSLAVDGRVEGAWAEFSTDYRLEDRRYSEFSEEDERILLGQSELIVGPQHRRYYAQISHSSREISVDPLREDLLSNRDNRVTSSVALFGSLEPGRGNFLSFWLEAADIQFDQSMENESLRHSVGVAFERGISPIYTTGLSLTYYDLQYRYIEQRDLTYSRAAAVWRAELRKLRYGFELGTNNMETEVSSTSSPSAKLDVSYQSGGQMLSVNYSQFLSDTSQGSNQGGEFDPLAEVDVDGRLDGQVDQYKSRQALLSWRHVQLCSGCTIGLRVGFSEEDYLNIKELSSREMRFGGNFSYRLNPSLSLGMTATVKDFEQTRNPLADGYQQSEVILNISFPNLMRNGNLSMYVGTLERDFDLREGYTSNFVGARFRYSLYER